MLNGLDPILIFSFFKLNPTAATEAEKTIMGLVSNTVSKFELPPIPFYLNHQSGLMIVSEDKNIDIATKAETLATGLPAEINQKGVGSVITINIEATKDSLGVTLLGALCELIFDKVTSKEYAITYIHGPITIFNGLLHSFSISSQSEDTKLNIKLEISRGNTQPKSTVQVTNEKTTASLEGGGRLEETTLPASGGGGNFRPPSGPNPQPKLGGTLN